MIPRVGRWGRRAAAGQSRNLTSWRWYRRHLASIEHARLMRVVSCPRNRGYRICRQAALPGAGGCGFIVRAAVRPGHWAPAGCAETVTVERVDGDTGWSRALKDRGVIHLAARAHVTRDSPKCARLFCRQCRRLESSPSSRGATGVRRFLYLSSIKVNGEATSGRPFRRGGRASRWRLRAVETDGRTIRQGGGGGLGNGECDHSSAPRLWAGC